MPIGATKKSPAGMFPIISSHIQRV